MADKSIHPGDVLTVRLAGGIERDVRALRQSGAVVYVTSEKRFKDAQAAGSEPEPLAGINIKDVVE